MVTSSAITGLLAATSQPAPFSPGAIWPSSPVAISSTGSSTMTSEANRFGVARSRR
ncbi:hypothetical protein QQW99_19450 [Bacillus amyloliquefaciens]|uniref:hypothetical protein n=1 Tax=Bacillus amyloliquefaciens TaxID=1390 RepID=UPI00255B5C5E|nr:hypothetical protein [Bacillus amyloliquefaciens]WIX29267.1 hypothetical protein QQW99_19450 [Bacillus amyloliquefaciens]